MKILVSGWMNNGSMDRAAKKLSYVGYTPVVLHTREGISTADWMKERLALYPECDGICLVDECNKYPFTVEKDLFKVCGKTIISIGKLNMLVVTNASFFDEWTPAIKEIRMGL